MVPEPDRFSLQQTRSQQCTASLVTEQSTTSVSVLLLHPLKYALCRRSRLRPSRSFSAQNKWEKQLGWRLRPPQLAEQQLAARKGVSEQDFSKPLVLTELLPVKLLLAALGHRGGNKGLCNPGPTDTGFHSLGPDSPPAGCSHLILFPKTKAGLASVPCRRLPCVTCTW